MQSKQAVEAMALREFADTDLAVYVDAAVLGEQVLFCGNRYAPTADDPVAYRARELAALIGLEPTAVRLAHAAKRVFPGARVFSTKFE